MKIENGQSVFDTFLPQAKRSDLAEGDGPRVKYVARSAALLGMVSLFLFAAEIFTIPTIATTVSWHIIIGLVLTGILVAKLTITFYRFYSFYANQSQFLKAGPPWAPLRILAVPFSLSTILLMGSGIELTFTGPSSFSTSFLQPAHTLISIFWLFLFGLHAFAYLQRSTRSTARDIRSLVVSSKRPRTQAGARSRFLVLVLAVLAGLGSSYYLRGPIRTWETAFHSGTSPSAPATPLIPVRNNYYSKHEIMLAQERLRTHLNDVKVLRGKG